MPPRRRSGAALDAALDDLGWLDALAADRAAAVSVLFECQGAANATSAALDRLLAAALGLERRTGAGRRPARRCGRMRPAGPRSTGDRCLVRGLGTAALGASDTASWSWPRPATASAVAVVGVDRAAAAAGARPRPCAGPGRGHGRCVAPRRQRSGAGRLGGRRGRSGSSPSATSWSARRGPCSSWPVRTRSSAMQFGRPIATFQAVRHRLAESLVAMEAAAALLDAAWGDPSPVTAAMAKALRRAVGPHASPATASRCWPASASPPSTRSTSTSGGRSCSTSCSARAACSPASWAPTSSPRRHAAGRLPALRPSAAGAAAGPLDYADARF